MHLSDMHRALLTLPPERREALLLVGAGGFTYEEAAEIADCAVGTMKSRVARARAELNRLLNTEPDPQALAKRNAAVRARTRNDSSSNRSEPSFQVAIASCRSPSSGRNASQDSALSRWACGSAGAVISR